jgi:hypothetical protein
MKGGLSTEAENRLSNRPLEAAEARMAHTVGLVGFDEASGLFMNNAG